MRSTKKENGVVGGLTVDCGELVLVASPSSPSKNRYFLFLIVDLN